MLLIVQFQKIKSFSNILREIASKSIDIWPYTNISVVHLDFFSTCIIFYSICTDHKGESLKTQRTAKESPNNLKFNICSQWSMINLFLNEPPKKVKKNPLMTMAI
jgi:hypothetical protein